MRANRAPTQIRPIVVRRGYSRHAEGSALIEWGDNRVLATVTVESKLPAHLRGRGQRGGWLTAEYSLLPRSTHDRTPRERLYAGGRTQEIQRLIGRSLRSVTDLTLFPNRTLIVDVDVLQADGGTRCAGVLAGYIALHEAADRLIFAGNIDEWPLIHEVAAVSVGLIAGETYVDLEYSEDVKAEVDLNVIATGDGHLIEVQGGTEERPLPTEQFVRLVETGMASVGQILSTVRAQLARPA